MELTLYMPYTKAVITDPYFDCPIWLENNNIIRREYICLSSDCSNIDVELFLILLFGYNDIDSKYSFKKAFNELFNKNEIAISGGIAFFEDENNYILPSCCCGLEDWKEVEMSINNKNSPWLGHDPTPGITYDKDHLIVWSDDPKETNHSILNIKYLYDEIFKCLKKTEIDLREFIQKPLHNWLYSKDKK